MIAIRAGPQRRRRVCAVYVRIPWNAKRLACDTCGQSEPVPPDLLLRYRLKTCSPCLTARGR